ncbi:MAG: hypothetical protein PHD58_06950, partial [Anaerolineales bacterium]|nr:hypothetical protein [Anaerolineales bacterium]
MSEATRQLLAHFTPLQSICLPLDQARNQISAEDVQASFDLPQFTNASMDGFAVRSTDVVAAGEQSPVRLEVVADIPAGRWLQLRLEAGKAARIMTGAPLPDGADAVVPVEGTDVRLRRPGQPAPPSVLIFTPVQAGDNVRRKASDVKAGDLILPKGRRLQPQDLGML